MFTFTGFSTKCVSCFLTMFIYICGKNAILTFIGSVSLYGKQVHSSFITGSKKFLKSFCSYFSQLFFREILSKRKANIWNNEVMWNIIFRQCMLFIDEC